MQKSEMKKYYTLEYDMNKAGKVIEVAKYIGEYVTFPSQRYTKHVVSIKLGLMSGGMLALALVSALLNSDSSRNFFIGIPFVFVFLPLIYVVRGMADLITAKEPMTMIRYNQSILRVQRSSWGVVGLMVYISVASIIFTVVQFSNVNVGMEIVFGLVNIGNLVLSRFQIQYLHRVRENVTMTKSKDT